MKPTAIEPSTDTGANARMAVRMRWQVVRCHDNALLAASEVEGVARGLVELMNEGRPGYVRLRDRRVER